MSFNPYELLSDVVAEVVKAPIAVPLAVVAGIGKGTEAIGEILSPNHYE